LPAQHAGVRKQAQGTDRFYFLAINKGPKRWASSFSWGFIIGTVSEPFGPPAPNPFQSRA